MGSASLWADHSGGGGLLAALREVGEGSGFGSTCAPRTQAQVAVAWVISKEAVTIPGAKQGHQAGENFGALGWTLSEEDVYVCSVSKHGSLFVRRRSVFLYLIPPSRPSTRRRISTRVPRSVPQSDPTSLDPALNPSPASLGPSTNPSRRPSIHA